MNNERRKSIENAISATIYTRASQEVREKKVGHQGRTRRRGRCDRQRGMRRRGGGGYYGDRGRGRQGRVRQKTTMIEAKIIVLHIVL